MTEPTSIVSRQTLSRGFAHVQRIVFRRCRTDGEIAEFERDIMDTGDGVAILPYDPSRGMIILIRQFRGVAFLKEKRETLIEVCAGKLEGVDPLARVINETEEETGIRLSDTPQELFTAYSTPGSFCERLTYYVAPYAAEDRITRGGGLKDEDEDIEVIELTLDAALGMVERGEIIDAKTLLLLFYMKANGILSRETSRAAEA